MDELLQSSIDGYIAGGGIKLPMQQITGGEVSRDVGDTRDPGARFSRPVPAPGTITNVVCTTDLSLTGHNGSIRSTLRQHATDRTEYSVTRYYRDGSRNISSTDTYTAIVVRVGGLDGNTNGGADKSTLVVEFKCSNVVSS